MKRILTLALALAFAFALAAPALAITGDNSPEQTNPALAPVTIDIELYTAPEATLGGNLYLSKIAADKMYVVNEVAYWGLTMDFAPEDEDHPLAMHRQDYREAVLTIKCDAFKLKDVRDADSYRKDGTDKVERNSVFGKPMLVDDHLEMNFPFNNNKNNPWEKDRTLYFFGEGVVTGKGVLKAELKKSYGFPDTTLPIFNGEDRIYRVLFNENQGDYHVIDEDENRVRFFMDEDEVFRISVRLEGASVAGFQEVEFKKLPSGGSSVVMKIGDFEGDEFDEAKKVYEGVMKFFGFNYDAEGYLLPKHFLAKSSALNLKDEVAVNVYTGAIVLPGPDVPKTGDAATVFGFVMIALALVAAGVVVSRRIRA
ncbi:MAG: hypothetical protein BWY11_00721 [Firmicutes bacterium ADurb.Bin182]|nr:MAG: hypothetical protein BWY11_00721 [Firmicutes bacterium ADurb.Bin182]